MKERPAPCHILCTNLLSFVCFTPWALALLQGSVVYAYAVLNIAYACVYIYNIICMHIVSSGFTIPMIPFAESLCERSVLGADIMERQ